ncbi:MAG: FimV/HubP family polar landmark protein [Methylomonas sp.]
MKLKSVAYICKTLAVVSLLTPRIGLPFSIGEIHLNSALNQTVNAEFKLNLAEGENASDISVRLATPEKFEQAGMAWNQFLSNLQFQSISQGNGSVSVKVSSTQPLTGPALSFLVEISSPQGTQVKEFTAQTAPVINQPQLVLPVTTDTSSETVKPIKKTAGFNPESLNATGTEYGPLKASDTLWSIAAHLGKERGLSTKQMLTALQKANPDAFNNGSIDSLKPEAILQIPSAEASVELASKPQPLIEHAPAIRNKALELVAPTETTISDKTEVGSQAKSEPQPEPNPSTPPVIANSPATSNSDYLALQTKITALEQQLSMMQQLLALKDQQLAILQNANKNQFALANSPQQIKSESEQSLWLIASLGLSVLTGLGWLLWRKNQQAQQQQRDVEAIFATDGLQPAPAINDGFSLDPIATPDQASASKSDFDFNLDFFEAPSVAKITDINDTDWADNDENETKIDLAKAYIDMGDLEMAKIITEEVIQTGNQQQKVQAEALLAEL